MRFKIDKRVPVPPARTEGTEVQNTCERLTVGDSFHVRNDDMVAKKVRCVIANLNARRKPRRWIYRLQDGGVRVWRQK